MYMCVPLFIAINSEPQTPAQNIDYTFAREELMLNELSNDPIQRAIARLEKQHEEDKQVFLGIDDVWRRFSKILLISKQGISHICFKSDASPTIFSRKVKNYLEIYKKLPIFYFNFFNRF